ncbi:MAG: hypothetical protein U0527_07965 [Candidatus Eisenbacteria bacterium]
MTPSGHPPRAGGGFSLSGSIKLGNDTPPFQLPNGSITYGLDGVHR